MLGKIKRRWRRFQFYNQVHYPKFFHVLNFISFPAQVALLAVTLWAVVGWYIGFMNESAQQQISKETINQVQATGPPPLAAALDTQPANTIDPQAPVQLALAKSAPDKNTSVQIVSPDNAQAEDISQRPSALKRTAPIVDKNWLLKQQNGFVIQVSTSTRPEKLKAIAQTFGNIEPVVIYPFKKTSTGQPLFGLSVGHYRSYLTAKDKYTKMPAEVQIAEPWIRSVIELQKAIRITENSGTATFADAQ